MSRTPNHISPARKSSVCKRPIIRRDITPLTRIARWVAVITLPIAEDGREYFTLVDAGACIAALPSEVHVPGLPAPTTSEQ